MTDCWLLACSFTTEHRIVCVKLCALKKGGNQLVASAGRPAQAASMQSAHTAAQQMAQGKTASPTPGACLCATPCPARPAPAHPRPHQLLGAPVAMAVTHATSPPAASRTANQRSRPLTQAAGSSSSSSHSARNPSLIGNSARRAMEMRRSALSSQQTGTAPHLAAHARATCRTMRYVCCLLLCERCQLMHRPRA